MQSDLSKHIERPDDISGWRMLDRVHSCYNGSSREVPLVIVGDWSVFCSAVSTECEK